LFEERAKRKFKNVELEILKRVLLTAFQRMTYLLRFLSLHKRLTLLTLFFPPAHFHGMEISF